MSQLIITCLSPFVRETLLELTGDTRVDTVPECPPGTRIKIAFAKTAGTPRRKRAPSEYNLFIKECVRGRSKDESTPDAFRRCASRWRKRS